MGATTSPLLGHPLAVDGFSTITGEKHSCLLTMFLAKHHLSGGVLFLYRLYFEGARNFIPSYYLSSLILLL